MPVVTRRVASIELAARATRADVENVRHGIYEARQVVTRRLARAQAEEDVATAGRLTGRIQILGELLDFLEARADLADLQALVQEGRHILGPDGVLYGLPQRDV
jgi:hypothetical protein